MSDKLLTERHKAAPPDVAAILTSLRDEVRTRRLALAGDSEHSAARTAMERQLEQCMEQIEITRVVHSHWPLIGRNIFERGWFLVHRVVRRYLHWYINPIVDQQNAFNDVTARTLRLLVEAYGDLYGQVAALEQPDTGTEQDGSCGKPVLHCGEPDADCGQPDEQGERDRQGEQGEQDEQEQPPPDIPDVPDVSDIPDPAALARVLQEQVAQRGTHEPPAHLPDIALRGMHKHVALHQTISAHWPLEGDTLTRKLAATVQKLIRRYLRWLINPIVEQQNTCNAAVSATVPPLVATDAELRAALAARRARSVV